MQARKQVVALLKKYEMDHEDLDMEETCGLFLEEMQKGLAGKASSLKMIPTYIETGKDIPTDEPVIVMDAGGTNFRVAAVRFDQARKPAIENFQVYSMPGSKGRVTRKEFFEIMAGYIEPVLDTGPNVGFCFSYPVEIFPNKDGKVLYFSKEIQAPQVEGNMIGENLNLAIRDLGRDGDKHIVILNDTVATLLAGRAYFHDRPFSSFVGFILGTGTNCSYIDGNRNITKNSDLDPAGSQIINIESGGFACAPQGKVDIQLDEASRCPGIYTFEKMISGAYLGELCLRTAQQAAEDGLFSAAVAAELAKTGDTGTKDINDFLHHPKGSNPLAAVLKNGTDEDRTKLYYLLDKLTERAAKLTAVNLSSAVLKSGEGKNPCFPVCIVAEGTTFYHLKSLKARVEYYLKQYLENEKGRYVEIVQVEDATLIGAAIAGLTN